MRIYCLLFILFCYSISMYFTFSALLELTPFFQTLFQERILMAQTMMKIPIKLCSVNRI
jgi:hypothetical protein